KNYESWNPRCIGIFYRRATHVSQMLCIGVLEMVERPDRYRNAIVPHIYVNGASDGIAFYKRAFGAIELFRIAHPNGKILHAEISICGSVVMIGDPDERLYAEPQAVGRCTAG